MPFALVTGASRGFGAALTRALVRDGWDVVVDARDPEALRRMTGDLPRRDAVTVVPGDVGDPRHRRALAEAVSELGSLELLVNNAGTLGPAPLPALADVPPDELSATFATNVVAPIALTQLLLPALRRAEGAIVNLTSDAAVEAYPGWGAYGSSKAALDQLSAVLAEELPDLRVYAFDPGDMRTRMHQDAFPGEDISDRPEPDEVVPQLLQLLLDRPRSGRYRASDLVAASGVLA